MRSYLNADVGEGAGFDASIIPLVGSVNISCGAHAGTESDITQAIQIARDCQIGAHPGYADPDNFGRLELELSLCELRESLSKQLNYLDRLVTAHGRKLSYIKPHGALYNKMARDYHFASELIEILQEWRALPIVALAGSQAIEAGADLGVEMIAEGFLDRTYTDSGLLVPRSDPAALISCPDRARSQAHAMLSGEAFRTLSGQYIMIEATSICVHGDTAHAVEFLHAISPPNSESSNS